MTRRLLTKREAADFLGVHPNTLTRRADAGDIPFYVVSSRGDRRYDQGELDLYLLRRRVEGPKATSYIDRFGNERCSMCGYRLPQHHENCDVKPWAPGELQEAYGK